jgi:hypothetical protein
VIRTLIVRVLKTYVASSLEDGMVAFVMILVLWLTVIGVRSCTRDWVDRTYGTHIASVD